MKRDESLSPSLFTFRSYFATVHRYYYYDFMTARGMRLPWAHRTRLQRLLLLLLTANVSNKSGNLLFAQSYPEEYENVGFVHSWCTVELKQEAIPHAAIHSCTNHFFLVKSLGESEFDSACPVERFQLLGGEFQIQTGEIVLELGYFPRSNDWDYWHRLITQP